MYEGKKKIIFKTREEIFKNIIDVGIVGLVALTAISLLFTFLSIAVYAATIEHRMSLTDYLYNSDYNHSILKFILFITGVLGLLFVVLTVSVGLIFFIIKRNWFGITIIVLSISSIIFLFFIPFRQNEKVYFVKGTIRPEMFTKKQYNYYDEETYKTGEYSTAKDAKTAFQRQALLPTSYFKTKVVTKIKKVNKPLITLSLPSKPLEYENTY
ncbi:hypothetical protein [Lactococcus lactis]|uniref:hypothetical protein n=1 Tax=Lactococcus lactis TaxID=1358 RepID=UPI002891EC83|nr:hypothetical protein [Lactococcus lactis]MDT2909313.1 hypothetical protein [Lactococcus lactis]MDT2925157.1 hypothetical protein [Lactococcus lactis]MDT2952016.1 hypothetical protein [Lactococcus lactis]